MAVASQKSANRLPKGCQKPDTSQQHVGLKVAKGWPTVSQRIFLNVIHKSSKSQPFFLWGSLFEERGYFSGRCLSEKVEPFSQRAFLGKHSQGFPLKNV